VTPQAPVPKHSAEYEKSLNYRRTRELENMRLFDKRNQFEEGYHIIDGEWFAKWVNFAEGKGVPPGVISYRNLLDNRRPKPGLRINQDYRALTKDQWSFLSSIYGGDKPYIVPVFDIYSASPKDFKLTRQDSFSTQSTVTSNGNKSHSPSSSKDIPTKSFDNILPKYSISSQKLSDRAKNFSIIDEEASDSAPHKPKQALDIQSKPIFKRAPNPTRAGVVGLDNPQFFCYMNSALQCLFSIQPFADYFAEEKYVHQGGGKKPLARILGDISRALFHESRSSYRPSSLWNFVSSKFPAGRQHDLPEFLLYILDIIDKELLIDFKPRIKDAWEQYKLKHSQAICYMSGMTCSRVTCCKCKNVSDTYEPFTYLFLETEPTVEKALLHFTKEETISAEYLCEKCNRRTDIKKRMFIVHPPEYLILQIKRFQYLPYPKKLSNTVRFGLNLTLEDCSTEPARYELISLAEHSGSMKSGHYISYAKRNNNWYLFDDSDCSEASLNEVLKAQAYLLVYQRTS